MRASIRGRVGLEAGEHVGLAYTTLAPVAQDGKVPDKAKDPWLAELADAAIVPDYRAHVDAWIASFAHTSARLFTLTFDARLLLGYGNASGTDVGLTVHHTWGVPIVPGSALKGTLAHHVATTYGSDPSVTTSDPVHDPWRGVGWAGTAIARGPGALYRALFGAPDADDDRATGAPGATRGYVVFHDALYLGLASPVREVISPAPESTRPFAADTLTVHQKRYYDGRGKSEPCDHDDPNPVGFLTVRPKAQFVVVLEGPPDWTALAGQLLRESLAQRGVGGKTTNAYGRATLTEARAPAPPPSAAVAEFSAWLDEARRGGVTQRDLLARIQDEQLERLCALSDADRTAAAGLIRRAIKNPRLKEQIDALCAGMKILAP
ncbi:MAG TPA: type III-B CRISPR module RAMP protein Cmr6 [Kofleriaceae bacterium]